MPSFFELADSLDSVARLTRSASDAAQAWLLYHHERDACVQCRPQDVQLIMRGLNNAPVSKQIMVNGGANPTGDACGAQHWHGFVGMEKEAVDIISNWIRNPVR